MTRFLGFLCGAITFVVLGDAFAVPTVGGCQVFPANNYWNTPVDTLPVHSSSAAWVSSIGTSTQLHPDWGNVLSDYYGIPYATVLGSQPLVPITFDSNGYPDESDPGPWPIPPNAPVEGGPSGDGDRHVIVIDVSACVLYELYNATPQANGASWSVYSSAHWDLHSNALRPDTWTSADAAGLPIFPGLVRWDEVAAGEIAHAIRFTAVNIWGSSNGRSYYLWPARHASGSKKATQNEIIRFRDYPIKGLLTDDLHSFRRPPLVLDFQAEQSDLDGRRRGRSSWNAGLAAPRTRNRDRRIWKREPVSSC